MAEAPDPDSEVRAKIHRAVAEQLGIRVSEVRPDMPLGEIFSSLDTVELLMALDEVLQVDLPVDIDAGAIRTLEDLVSVAEAAQRRPPPDGTMKPWTWN